MSHSILNRIAKHKLEEVRQAKQSKPQHSLKRALDLIQSDFIAALIKSPSPVIIAEIKKASPSLGLICQAFDVVEIAKTYAKHGACCLSVLTDVEFFQGHPDYLGLAKRASQLPILRKDFIVDAYQVYESWALGADCILLITALLSAQQLKDYCCIAQELNMAVLVESHSLEELALSLTLPTKLIGINNRSLHDFHTNIQQSIDLKAYIPSDKLIITESGIHTEEDIKRLQAHGIHHFLVGESLMKASDPGVALERLRAS